MNDNLAILFKKWAGTMPETITLLPQSGSYRQYYRIESAGKSVLGAYNEDRKENSAFIGLSKHFRAKGLKVPEIYAENLEKHIYLQEDFGDETLFKRVSRIKKEGKIREIIPIYQKVLNDLADFQVKGRDKLDFDICYPRAAFDKQSITWDLNYFKYSFLKIVKAPFNEQLLEDDFQKFTDYLLQTDCSFFLYRDFQSRNIMLEGDNPCYIDFQGGRKGALQYDVASLLFESKVNLPFDIRKELLEYYTRVIRDRYNINSQEFITYYYPYVLIRLLQAMGAYGFRGLIERKELFIESIPFALNSLRWIIENTRFEIHLPELMKVFEYLTTNSFMKKYLSMEQRLRITISSFSYKRGIPVDLSGNGGGFVFDCRAIENPGRQEKYRNLSGRDEGVKQFIKTNTRMGFFLEQIFPIVDQTVENYTKRKFKNLSVSFGCTGGQHRSVYAAEKLKRHIMKKFNKVEIVIQHLELKVREEINVWKE